jgi:hypothetical protein
MVLTLEPLIVTALGSTVLLATAIARGSLGTRIAARRIRAADEPATRLPADLAELHLRLLGARTRLRLASEVPLSRVIDLRHPLPGDGRTDPDLESLRREVTQLWLRHAAVLGSPDRPCWHLHGRSHWWRLGPLGHEVLIVRATAGHDPGRWIGLRVVRRPTGRWGIGGGSRAVRTGVTAADPTDLLTRLPRHLGAGAWRVEHIEVLERSGLDAPQTPRPVAA